MKTAKLVKMVDINHPEYPGTVISLNIYDVEGGYVGVDSSFTDEVANYIANPYAECQLVKLPDPIGNDDEIDPPLEEDELVGFLRILVAFDSTIQLLPVEQQEIIMNGLAKRSGLSRDRLSVLLGLARQEIDSIALFQFVQVLKPESENGN